MSLKKPQELADHPPRGRMFHTPYPSYSRSRGVMSRNLSEDIMSLVEVQKVKSSLMYLEVFLFNKKTENRILMHYKQVFCEC